MKVVYAAAILLLSSDNKILLAKRPEGKIMPGYWEFPGGKLNDDELPEECAIREAREEIGIVARNLKPFSFISETRSDYHVIVYLFTCKEWDGTPHGEESQEIAWVDANKLDGYNLLPGNRPLVPAIKQLLI